MPDPDRDKAPRGRRPIGWMLGIFAAVVLTGFLALRSEMGQMLLGHWSFVRSIADDQGTYYRLKVKLTYKGEPQDFDNVVGCNVRRIIYKDNSSTYEAGLIPDVFGRRMNDGKGLVIRPPNACAGETTANGRVQADLLPIVIVYDDAETLDFGAAYLSEDAYESPLSSLKFGGATIESANRSDFDRFRQRETNLVSRRSYWSALAGYVALSRMNIEPVPKPWAHICEGYKRFRLPNDLRTMVREQWPAERPHYWVAPRADQTRIEWAIRNSGSIQPDRPDSRLGSLGSFGSISGHEADYGMPTRAGGGLVEPTRGKWFAGAYYPAASDLRLEYVPANNEFADTSIAFKDGLWRGFAYCFVSARPPSLTEGSKRLWLRIDGEDVARTFLEPGPPLLILDRDEYAFTFFRINLESTRGDV